MGQQVSKMIVAEPTMDASSSDRTSSTRKVTKSTILLSNLPRTMFQAFPKPTTQWQDVQSD